MRSHSKVKYEDKIRMLDFLGFHESSKTYDLGLLQVDAYYKFYSSRMYMGKLVEQYEILINKKGTDAHCRYPWRPEEDWNHLFMVIDKICQLIQGTYSDFFSMTPSTTIEEVYKFITEWLTDYYTRIEKE